MANGVIKSWSYSRLKTFEKCPYTLQLSAVDKVPGPVRDENHPANRGTKVHKEAEDYVKGEVDVLPASLKKLKTEFEVLREEYAQGLTLVEQPWGFDEEWGQCDYWDQDKIWLRVKCDVAKFFEEDSAKIVDHKTGKSFGNEVSHVQQGQLYAVSTFMRYPQIDLVEASMWYIDEGKIKSRTYHRSKFLPIFENFNKRARVLTEMPVLLPKPNKFNCQWCDYGPQNGNNECPYGIE